MDSTVTAYRDAAAAFFAEIAGEKVFRTLQSGDRDVNIASWHAFRRFGLAEMLRDTDAEERAGVIAATSIEAGRALYTGPVMEGVAVVEGGSALPDDFVMAVDFSDRRLAADGIEKRIGDWPIAPFPYGNLARWVVAAMCTDGARALVVLDLSDEAAVMVDMPQIDGSIVSRLDSPMSVQSQQIIAVGEAAASAARSSSEFLLLSTSARLVGIAERVNQIVNEYISVRTQFGKTLSSFQALQHRVVDAHIEVELAGALLWRTVAEWDNLGDRHAVLFALKSHASRTALFAARQGVQMFGGMGFSDEGPVGSYLKHAMVLAARYGGEAVSRQRYREEGVDLFG